MDELTHGSFDEVGVERPNAGESRTELRILTVGHSSGDPAELAMTLRAHGVAVLADVRSHPSSAYAPQFNELALADTLRSRGIRYVPMGAELGGRPTGAGMYDKDGRVQYDRVAATPRFQAGVARLVAGSRVHRVAILCSEEDPTNCHRRLLVGRVLRTQGVVVEHLRGDGTIQTEDEVAAAERVKYPERYQQSLFGARENEWKSIQSVSVDTRLRNSSEN